MAFTGEAVRQGNTNRFGVGSPGSTPRSFVSFNGEPYVITRDALIHITDIENGSGVLIQNNTDYDLSNADPTCGFVHNGRMYFLDRSEDLLVVFDDPLTGDVGFVDFYDSSITPGAAASDGTTVWIYDSAFDALYTINPDTAATTLLGTVGFDVTTPANNIGGMFPYDGKLYLLDNGTELMFVIDDPSAATLEATAVDVSVVEFGAGQRGVNGGDVHLGESYMAGGNPDALYRFYNVRWNQNIDAIEVDAGGSTTKDLSTISKDATSFEFAPGYTAPSWLTISGNDLVITNAPDVATDTDFSPQVRAVRSSKHEDETLTVRVLAASITTPGVPTSLSLIQTHNSIIATWAGADDNGGENPSRYDIRINNGQWIDTGLDLTHTFENLSAETEYTVEVAQVNSVGRGAIASESVTTEAAPIVTSLVWQTGSAMESSIDALGTTRINIAGLVTRAKKIEAIGGLQEWTEFDGTYLDIAEAPILRKDTVFRFKFRATNDQSKRDGFYKLTVRGSKLSQLRSTLIFKSPINYDGDRVSVHGNPTTPVRQITDNNYKTHSTEKDMDINVADSDGNATAIDCIVLKTKGVDRYGFRPTGGSGTRFSNREMTTEYITTDGRRVSSIVNGFQHEIYPLPERVTATSVRLTVEGANTEIYAVMFLELLSEIRDGDFFDILPYKVDRTGQVQGAPKGSVRRVSPIGAERWKWEIDYILKIQPSGTSLNSVPAFLKLLEDNSHITHAQEPSRYPERIYPAAGTTLQIPEQQRGQYKGNGKLVPFQVAER